MKEKSIENKNELDGLACKKLYEDVIEACNKNRKAFKPVEMVYLLQKLIATMAFQGAENHVEAIKLLSLATDKALFVSVMRENEIKEMAEKKPKRKKK